MKKKIVTVAAAAALMLSAGSAFAGGGKSADAKAMADAIKSTGASVASTLIGGWGSVGGLSNGKVAAPK